MPHDFSDDLNTPTEADLDACYGSKYLSATEVGDRKIRTRIAKVRKQPLQQQGGATRNKFVLACTTLDKEIVLNSTNKNALVDALGRNLPTGSVLSRNLHGTDHVWRQADQGVAPAVLNKPVLRQPHPNQLPPRKSRGRTRRVIPARTSRQPSEPLRAAPNFCGAAHHLRGRIVADDADKFEELPEREPAWMLLDRATAYRKRLLAAGYSPIPVNGKAPPVAGWQDIEATKVLIAGWVNKYADATNTGILTRTTPAIDIDVFDAVVAHELQEIAERMIGASAVRIGQAPKRAMLFRVDEPFDKISTPVFVSPDGRTHKVEILCRGQQIVVHGIHPNTHAPYTWRGGEPGPELEHDALPLLNAEKANEFITAAAQFMSAHGWTSKKKPNGDAGGAWNTENPGSKRERLYALAALDGCADELAEAPNGERNNTLYKKAFRLGTMVARGMDLTVRSV